jgi:hypothetical protein
MSLVVLPNGHYALMSDEVYFFPLVDKDAAGNVVPAPSGDTVSVSASGAFAASVAVAVTVMPGTSNPAVSVTPLVMESDAGNSGGGIGLVMTDTAGLTEDTATSGLLFDIVMDVAPATEGVDITGVVMQSQPVPTAPGP